MYAIPPLVEHDFGPLCSPVAIGMAGSIFGPFISLCFDDHPSGYRSINRGHEPLAQQKLGDRYNIITDQR